MRKPYLLRYLVVIISMALNGLGVSLMRISCLGTDPFNSMNYSFSEAFHVSLGLVVIAVSCILLLLSFFHLKTPWDLAQWQICCFLEPRLIFGHH